MHYIGIMAMPPDPTIGESESSPHPSQDDLPSPTEEVLSNLARLPNLERVIVEFRCADNAEEEDEIYRDSYDIFEELEDDEQVLDAEKIDAYRSLMKRSYDALARNPACTIRNLELKNVVAKGCSSWRSDEFRSLLKNLRSFTISLRGGDNGAGWQINKVPAYLAFIESLDSKFFEHLHHSEHVHFSATTDGPPGLDSGLNNCALPLHKEHLTSLTSLELQHIFISRSLTAFITDHGRSLRSVHLIKCYAGLDDVHCAEEVAISWGDFFQIIATKDMPALHTFEVGHSDVESENIPNPGDYGYSTAMQAKDLRDSFPERRMFDYKHVDDKYGMLFDSDLTIERFEEAADHAGWEQLRGLLERNNGHRL